MGAALRRLMWTEQGVLLALGMLAGVAAAVVAILPGGGGGGLPVLLLVVGVALSGLLWVRLATALATRGPLLEALRDDAS